jgi:hypothetical protein
LVELRVCKRRNSESLTKLQSENLQTCKRSGMRRSGKWTPQGGHPPCKDLSEKSEHSQCIHRNLMRLNSVKYFWFFRFS